MDKFENSKKTEHSDFLNHSQQIGNKKRLYHTFKLMPAKSKLFVSLIILGIIFCTYFSINNTVKIVANYPFMKKIEAALDDMEQKEIKEPTPPHDWVKVPDTSFKSREEVTILFEQAGLKPLFVPQHIEYKADINQKNLSVGTTISIEEQPNVQYFGGDSYGYYAPKESEIIIGYSPVAYQYQERD